MTDEEILERFPDGPQRPRKPKPKRPPSWDEQLTDFDRGLLKVFGIAFNQLDKKPKEG